MLGAYTCIMYISPWWILPLSVMKCPTGSLFMAFVLKSIYSDINIANPDFFSCPFAWIFVCNPSFSVYVCLLFSDMSLVSSICVGHVFLSIQLPYVFWLEHSIHVHLRLLLIGTYSLLFYSLCTFVPFSLTVFLPLLKAVLLVMQILASKICCGCNIHIHTDYRNPVEKKGLCGRAPS